MKLKTKAYDAIATIQISDAVTGAEVAELCAEIQKKCTHYDAIVIGVESEKVEKAAWKELLKLRTQQLESKPRVFIASIIPDVADGHDMASVLEKIGTIESDRIMQIIDRQHSLEQLEREIEKIRNEVGSALGTKGDASPDEIKAALARKNAENRKQHYLLKSIEGEIAALQKSRSKRGAEVQLSPKQKEYLAAFDKKAIALMKSKGIP